MCKSKFTHSSSVEDIVNVVEKGYTTNNFTSILKFRMRTATLKISILALTVIPSMLFSVSTASAAINIAVRPNSVPSARVPIDGNVATFHALDSSTVLVEGTDSKLWLEHAPFGNVPPTRELIDVSVANFQALDFSTILVEGADGKLWLESAPFGNVPPTRVLVDVSVAIFQALDASTILVKGDNGTLWLDFGPFG